MDYDRLRELQEKFDENPRRYFAPLANEYRKGGQPKRAIEICRAHLAQMPGHMSGQIVYGQALYEAGEFDEAKEVFGRALALDPENLIALKSMGDMSLQAGNTSEARTWYKRVLDADPKDTAVIALISEMDAAEEAAPVEMATEIPGVDADAGDQAIPAGLETPELVFLSTDSSNAPGEGASPAVPSPADSSLGGASPAVPSSADSSPGEVAPLVPSAAQSQSPAAEAPAGLERHYPVQEASPSEASPAEAFSAQSSEVEPPSSEAPAQAAASEGLRAEDLGVTAGDSAAEGLRSAIPEAVSPLDWSGPPPAAQVEEPVARAPEPVAAEFAPPPEPPRPAPESPVRPAERTFSGASSEPFVNETMAQLYLQQGYKQLALQVYRQLAVSRPQDEGLRNRIAEIEAADAAEHPGEVAAPARREAPAARKEAPATRNEAPVERPTAPEEIAGRQSSVREFFATLGRRRPPHPSSRGGSRSGNNQPAPADTRAPLGAAPPSATLDTVFAGATVTAADARAASRLAGAFSGGTGSGRTSPPTPPVPTPRVNPRVPQAQESEEDVAKFRAWLDGLTGE
jgi:tetratricopeptide (TPR) repeat protein